MANEVAVWNRVMSKALEIPGVKVDRESFLRKELSPYCTPDEMEKALINPTKVVSLKRINAIANACIRNQTIKVTAISTVTGMPGGIAMAATIPADIAQYYWHTFVIAQKLAYLYGMPDLRDENGNFTETSQDMLTLFLGVMTGAAVANKAMANVSKSFAIQATKQLKRKALTKTFYYLPIKHIAKRLGYSINKEIFSKAIGKSIPIIGGVASGAITMATFTPSAKRLQKKLREQMYDLKNEREDIDAETLDEGTDFVDVTTEESTQKSENPMSLIIEFMINLSNISGKRTEAQTELISKEIEDSELDDDTKLSLAQELESGEQVKVDFSPLAGDDSSAAILLGEGAKILKGFDKVTLVEKLYFKKVAKQLGFTDEDIDEAMKA